MSHFHDEFETENLIVRRYAIGAFAVNTYIVMCKETKDAAVIDPGGDVEELCGAIKDMGANVVRLLFTHLHIDHVTGASGMKRAFPNALVTYHELDQVVAENLATQSRLFGVPDAVMPPCDKNLRVEPEFGVGNLQFSSVLTPGHTPGGVVYYLPLDKLCFTGDTLFRLSVGRTDLVAGSSTDLRSSLERLVRFLPDDTKILPGHGKYTQMGFEKANNPYLKVERIR